MKRLRLVLWILVGLAAAAVIALLLRTPEPSSGQVEQTVMAPIGGPFTLTGTDGQPFASSRLAGKPAAVFFGFTNCPDVCPTTLARLTKLRRQLGKGDDAFSIVFISVDPERDTPAEVGKYMALYDTPVVGLTGNAADIERVKKQFGVYSAKAPQPGGGYSVDHTAAVFLMDRNGGFVSTLAYEEGDDVALDKIRRITN
ncbi:SCO family protein [Sphingomonas sp. LY160]|uniref:SCO family protein n=1 Tax=Sphingomonas sp. LY160 TaxID=3095342 RepID=UPI002ADEBE15|nr:SCO family protein [Sphingomonas sp. LY160]MEA1073195.1 SCO family protein [Sphingomonas sp. LY160]